MKPDEIQFFDVDAALSAPVPRSKGYQIMNVPVTEDVSDAKKSNYVQGRLTPEGPKMVLAQSSIAIQPDAKTNHDLFHDRFFRGHVFCTDAFAMRVLRAGCTGMRFVDPAQLGIAQPKRFRTLRGIEEVGDWDPVRRIAPTKLIQAID